MGMPTAIRNEFGLSGFRFPLDLRLASAELIYDLFWLIAER
jgi:hypothetical protein